MSKKKLSIAELNDKYKSNTKYFLSLTGLDCNVTIMQWSKKDFSDVDIEDFRNIYFVMNIMSASGNDITAIFNESMNLITMPAVDDDSMPIMYNNVLSADDIFESTGRNRQENPNELATLISNIEGLKASIIQVRNDIDALNEEIYDMQQRSDETSFMLCISEEDEDGQLYIVDEHKRSLKILKYKDDDVDLMILCMPYSGAFLLSEHGDDEINIKSILKNAEFTYDDKNILRRKVNGVFVPFKYSVKSSGGIFLDFVTSENILVDIPTIYTLDISKVKFKDLKD